MTGSSWQQRYDDALERERAKIDPSAPTGATQAVAVLASEAALVVGVAVLVGRGIKAIGRAWSRR